MEQLYNNMASMLQHTGNMGVEIIYNLLLNFESDRRDKQDSSDSNESSDSIYCCTTRACYNLSCSLFV